MMNSQTVIKNGKKPQINIRKNKSDFGWIKLRITTGDPDTETGVKSLFSIRVNPPTKRDERRR